MLVRMCDSCRQVLDADHPCVAVAVRGKTGVALQRVNGGQLPASSSSHFCADECVVEFVKLWLMDGLPAAEQVGAVMYKIGPMAEPIVGNGHKPPVLEELDSDAPSLPPIPQLPTRREPTPEEIAAQNAILGSVLGGH